MRTQDDCVLILGATSEIGVHMAMRLAPCGFHFVLASRRPHDLDVASKALKRRGATGVETVFFDAVDLPSHELLITSVARKRRIAHVIVCFGILGDAELARQQWRHASDIVTVDYTAQVVALTVAAQILSRQSTGGCITVFSSIAGWRARKANYVYGSTKAGLDAFAQGLADSLSGTAVRVVIARPGFVIGSMTAGMTPAPLSVNAATVARVLVRELVSSPGVLRWRRARSRTVWIPRRLQILAWIMKFVPRSVWRRLPR